MALLAKAGVFVANTSTGDQAVTGVGLGAVGKAVIFFVGNRAADGNGAGGMQCLGFAASSTQREAHGMAVDDGVGTSNSGIDLENLALVLLNSGTPATDGTADFVSWDGTDGNFTINWSDAPASAVRINYVVLGGSDITNVEVGLWTLPTNSGLPKDASKTGMAFQPDMVLFAPARNVTAVGAGIVGATGLSGFTKYGGTFQQCGWANAVADAVTSSATKQYERTDKALVVTSTTVISEATAVSFNSDGWTLNFTTNTTSSSKVPYLAIKGGFWKIGSDLTPTSVGPLSKTGVGFLPALLMAFGNYNTASSSLLNGGGMNSSIGAASSPSAARAIGLGIVGTGLTAKNSSTDAKVISNITSLSAVAMEASLTSFDVDGWTLNFGTVTGTTREYLWLAAGSSSSGLVNVVPPSVTGSLVVGSTLTANAGTWTPVPSSFTYGWHRADDASGTNLQEITGATGSTYTLDVADTSKYIQAVVIPVP